MEFAVELDPEVIRSILAIAKKESKPMSTLVEEAFTDLVEKRARSWPRPHVLAAYLENCFQYNELYAKLAK